MPYVNLREYAKEFVSTRILISKLWSLRKPFDIYFSFIDSDTIDFNQIFTSYKRIHKEYSKCYGVVPTIMSTGYEFPIIEGVGNYFQIASRIDNAIR